MQIVFILVPSHIHAAVITQLTWNDPLNGNVTSTSGDGATNADIDIDMDSTLVSFVAGGVTHNNFVTANSTTASGASGVTPYYGLNSSPLSAANDSLSVTDLRLDTGQVNIGDNSDFLFASSPTTLADVFFVFEIGSADGALDVELIDGAGNVVGSTFNTNFSTASVADIDFQRVDGTGTANSVNAAFRGQTFTFADFGITNPTLAGSVAGIRLDSGGGLDPALIGFAVSIPEPSTALLTAMLGILALVGQRRRRQC